MNAGAQTVSPEDKAHRTGWLLRIPAGKEASQPTGDHVQTYRLLLSRSQRHKDIDTDTGNSQRV